MVVVACSVVLALPTTVVARAAEKKRFAIPMLGMADSLIKKSEHLYRNRGFCSNKPQKFCDREEEVTKYNKINIVARWSP